MTNTVSSALSGFFDLAKKEGIEFTTTYDAKWQSPCYAKDQYNDQNQVLWAPVKQNPQADFSQLEIALEIELDSQFKEYFGAYWSLNWIAAAQQGECELLQVWNQEDLERLQENLVGHVLMKKRLGQEVSLFFALTQADDLILCVDNASGQVVLEKVGQPYHEVIAPDLATFICSLKPVDAVSL